MNEQASLRRDWPQIGDIITNHDGYRPAPITTLAGSRHVVTLAAGAEATLTFETGTRLRWQEGASDLVHDYQAFQVRDGIVFIDLVDSSDPCHTVSAVLDTGRARLLILDGHVPASPPAVTDLLTRVRQTGSQSLATAAVRFGGLDGRPAAPAPPADKLLGQYLRYRYSDTHVYDHYYISDRYYLWFCWEGPDAKLGDFDEIEYYELGEELYLICWREKLLPALAVMIEDHRAMRSIGKVYGVDATTWAAGNTTVGAEMTRVSRIDPPAGSR